MDDDGNAVDEFRGVFQDNPTHTIYINNLVDVINTKSEKHKNYSKDCEFHNLIINDKGGGYNFELEDFYETFFISSMLETVLKSPFKEITIIIHHKEDQYYLNLKELIFIKKLFLFTDGYGAIKKVPTVIINQYIADLFTFISKIGLNGFYLYFEKELFEIVYNRVGIVILQRDVITLQVTNYNYFKKSPYDGFQKILDALPVKADESL